MRFFTVFLLITLMACSSPSLKFSGISPVQVAVEGSVFDVYSNGKEVQAIRVNFQVLPSMSTTIARAISAIESATGCKVVPSSITGDQALVKANITCKDT
ncbi:MAG: hypothetical protein V3V13_10350 [Paracoccaceae bacterium]